MATKARHTRVFEQLSPETALTGPPVVSLALTPQDLDSRAKLEWSEQDTELGASDLAILRLGPAGPRFSLQSFRESPFPTIDVAADEDATSADIDGLLAALDIRPKEILDRVDGVGAAQQAIAQREPQLVFVEPSHRTRSAARRGGAPRGSGRPRPGMAPLIEAVAADSGLSESEATRAIESLLATVSERLGRGDEVALAGFGKFSVAHRAARQGVNPRTGETVKIKASKVPKFTPGAALKRAVGPKKSQ